ncbi:hypothetical protein XcodCFBP4690_00760 [Xanthomonas codiaei]|uniref:Uncharacterized protein n=1 Tax=Xanthomonas codiaei TaxID=56463 RepID=A0A2S7CYP1_9XANT|nr:hypothetical protein XcodCFBP4690_00760 [Xanthomonas codiaei]
MRPARPGVMRLADSQRTTRSNGTRADEANRHMHAVPHAQWLRMRRTGRPCARARQRTLRGDAAARGICGEHFDNTARLPALPRIAARRCASACASV